MFICVIAWITRAERIYPALFEEWNKDQSQGGGLSQSGLFPGKSTLKNG